MPNALSESPMARVIRDANIPPDDLPLVRSTVTRTWNITGGRPSDAARSVVADYLRDPAGFVRRFHAERDQERATGVDCFGSPLRPTEKAIQSAIERL